MSALINLILTFGAGFLAWRFTAKALGKRGKGPLVRHLIAMPVAFVASFLTVGIILGTGFGEQSPAEAAEEAKRVATAQAAETAKKAEEAAAEKAKSEAKDRSSMASIICKAYVKEQLKAPASADFPLLDFKAWKQPNQKYIIKSYVDAQNSYGANLRSQWHCEIQYNGGEEADSASWTLHDLEII